MRGAVVAIRTVHFPDDESATLRFGSGTQVRRFAPCRLVGVFDPRDGLPPLIGVPIADAYARSEVSAVNADARFAAADLHHHDGLRHGVAGIVGEFRKNSQAIPAVLLRPVT